MTTNDDSVSASAIRETLMRYAEALTAGDTDRVVALFADNAVLIDPVGSSPHVGHRAIREFFQRGFDATGGRILFKREGDVRVCGRHAAAAFVAVCDRADPPFEVDTLDVAEFDEDGRIALWVAYFGETNVRPMKKAK